MNQRGFTLMEVLLAALIGAVVLLGIGSFYISMVNAYKQGNDQALVQRQATMIQDELARRILPAYQVATGPCGGGTTTTDSLLVTLPDNKFLCFYQEGEQMFECDVLAPTVNNLCAQGTKRNLLNGSPTLLPAGGLVFQREAGGSSVAITFQLQDAKLILNPVSFGMRVTVRN